MDELSFEWDDRKNRANIKKHGVSFDETRTVFYDENASHFFDPDLCENEHRSGHPAINCRAISCRPAGTSPVGTVGNSLGFQP
jgi:hypothetical protein